jgi:hypothetical protein
MRLPVRLRHLLEDEAEHVVTAHAVVEGVHESLDLGAALDVGFGFKHARTLQLFTAVSLHCFCGLVREDWPSPRQASNAQCCAGSVH